MKKLVTLFWGLASFLWLQAQTTLPTFWNFSTPAIATPPQGWTMNLGTNGNLTYAFGIGDALSCRLDATGENFIVAFTDKPGPISYYLSPQNAGSPWGGQFDIQESANGTNWTTIRSITSKSTTATNFNGGRYQDNLSASTRFVRFIFTTKLPGGQPSAPGGNMAVDSVFIRKGLASEATISIKKGSTTLVNGLVYVVGNSDSTVFSIENAGAEQTLRIDSVRLQGTHASDYTYSLLADTVSPLASQNLKLYFNPQDSGSRLANLLVYSNDALKNPFLIKLYGIGGRFASEPSASASALNFSDIKSYRHTLSLVPSIGAAEKYLVVKSTMPLTGNGPLDGVSYKRGDAIGNGQVAFFADTAISYTPNATVQGQTYYYSAFSFNGPTGFENYYAVPATASVTNLNANPGTYYGTLDPLKSSFVSDLSSKINPHDTVFYSLYIPRVVDPWLARDTADGKEVVTCVYTGSQYVYTDPFQWAAGNNGATLTREHTYPQSWMPSNQGNPSWPNAPGTNRELPEFNDLHNLFPAHQANANARRSNNPFGTVVTPTYTAPTGFGVLGKDSAGKTVYEPRAEQKGDVARALFYMAVCYNGVGGKNWALPAQQDQNLLKAWARQDPPDAFEKSRNEFIHATQGNRNPFIDNPNWMDAIDFSNMTWIDNNPPVPVPAILLVKPNSDVIWTKGEDLTVQWESENIDSVELLMSVDSGLTYSSMGVFSSSKDSVVLQPNLTPTSDFGLIIVKDIHSNAADTSELFEIKKPVGLKKIGNAVSQFSIFPVPVKDGSFFLATQEAFTEIGIQDIQGRKLGFEISQDNRIQLSPGFEGKLAIITLKFHSGIQSRLLIFE